MAIYTCVLLDVDNTLLDFDAAERQALTDMLAEYELPHDEATYDTYHKVNRELWDSLAKGQLNKQKLFQIRFSRFMQTMQLPDNGKGKAMNDRYEELLATHADLLPGALTALEELSEVATLALVSNGAIAVQESRIAPPASTGTWTAFIFPRRSARPSPAPSCLSMPSVTSASRTRAVC